MFLSPLPNTHIMNIISLSWVHIFIILHIITSNHSSFEELQLLSVL